MGESRELVVGGGSTVPRASEMCSTALWKHVGHGDDSRRAIEFALSAKNAVEIVEDAKLAAPKLREHARAAGPETVEAAILKLSLTLGDGFKDGAEWTAAIGEYVEGLEGFPLEAIHRGAVECRDEPGRTRFPTVGELVKFMKPHADRIRAAAYRASRIAEAEAKAKRPPDDPEEKARQIALTQEFLASMGSKNATLQNDGPKPPPRTDPPPRPRAVAQGFPPAPPAPGSLLTRETLIALGRPIPAPPIPEHHSAPLDDEAALEPHEEEVALPW